MRGLRWAAWPIIILALEILVSNWARAEIPLRYFFAANWHQNCAKSRIFPLFERLIRQAPGDEVYGFLAFYFIENGLDIGSRKAGIVSVINFKSERYRTWIYYAVCFGPNLLAHGFRFNVPIVLHLGLLSQAVGSGGFGFRV